MNKNTNAQETMHEICKSSLDLEDALNMIKGVMHNLDYLTMAFDTAGEVEISNALNPIVNTLQEQCKKAGIAKDNIYFLSSGKSKI